MNKFDKNVVGAVLTDVSKAFDYTPHDLLVAKHEAYGFKSDTVAYICSVWTIEAKCHNKWHSKLPLRCYFRCSAGISMKPILCNLLLRIHFRLLMILQTSNVYEAIVTRNGLIVWKCGPNWPFSALMLRTKLY